LILPFIEQDTVWNQADAFARSDPTSSWSPWGNGGTWYGLSGANSNDGPNPAQGLVMPVYNCPSDWRTLVVNIDYGIGPTPMGFTDYVGNMGSAPGSAGDKGNGGPDSAVPLNGVLYPDSKVKLIQILDGTSNTLFVGEHPPSNDFNLGWWFDGAGMDNSGNMEILMNSWGFADPAVIFFVSNYYPQYQPCLGNPAYNGFQPGDPNNMCSIGHYWSLHPGGMNALMCDGSVRFLYYGMNPVTFAAACTRAGGEIANFD